MLLHTPPLSPASKYQNISSLKSQRCGVSGRTISLATPSVFLCEGGQCILRNANLWTVVPCFQQLSWPMTQRGGGIGGETSDSHSQGMDRLFPAGKQVFHTSSHNSLHFLWPWPHIRVWDMRFPTDLLLLNLGLGGTSIFFFNSLQIVVKHSLVESHIHTEKGSSVSSIQKSPPQMAFWVTTMTTEPCLKSLQIRESESA